MAASVDVIAPDAVAVSRLLQLLADPTRLAAVECLVERPHTVAELMAALGVPRSRLGNHLACLRWCGLADTEKRGRSVVYSLKDPRIVELLAVARRVAAPHVDHLSSCERIGPQWL